MIDVAAGGGDSFSLEGPDGLHFVARSPSNAAAEDGSRDDPRDAPLPIPDI